MVGDDGSVENISEDVHDSLGRDGADAAFINEIHEKLEPEGAADFFVLEINRAAAVFEFGALLDEKFDELGVVLEELEICDDRGADFVNLIAGGTAGFVNVTAGLGHSLLDDGEEEFFLAGEVAVDSALADFEPVGDPLDVCGGEAMPGKERGGDLEYGGTAAFLERFIRWSTGASFGDESHECLN
jgi:hypothetical protein